MEATRVDNSIVSNAVPRANVTNPPYVFEAIHLRRSTEVPKETQVAPTAEGEKVPVEPEVKESEKDVPSEEDPVLVMFVSYRQEEEEDNYGDDEEDYIEEEEEEEEDWLSDDDSPVAVFCMLLYQRAPKHGKRNETHNSDDEDYAHSKRRKVEVVKRPPRRNLTANESVGMKALRTYTTALKLGQS